MKLIIGLGNPGKDYEKTRHNIGFFVLDELGRAGSFKQVNNLFSEAFIEIQKEKVILIKPTCFMNRSGEAVRACIESYRLSLKDTLVVLDDVNLPIGRIRFRAKGSAGGHHGLESIIGELGTNQFARLRVGVGREGLAGKDLTDYVLGRFERDEWRMLTGVLLRAKSACQEWVSKGSRFVMNQYNREVLGETNPSKSAEN